MIAFVERRISARERQQLEAHLDACASCLALVSELSRFDETSLKATSRAASREHPDAVPGTLLGKYRLLTLLGEGATGWVYAAQDTELDRKVALKLLRPNVLPLHEARVRLSREARAMAKLKHPNVVTVYDAGEIHGRLFIAMEFVEGQTLGMWSRQQPRPWREALEVVLRAGEGLHAAHQAGIVHRDFKPDNVLLDAQRRVAVTDFGLATPPRAEALTPAAEQTTSGLGVTDTGVVLGTPRYMSPEQHAGLKVDARSDQFSFAVTVYEAVYARRPFEGEDLDTLRAAVTSGDIVPPSRDAEPPAGVFTVLRRAMSPDPDARYPTLQGMLTELQRFAGGSRAGARAQRFRVLAVSIVTVLTAALGLSLWWNRQATNALSARTSATASASSPTAPAMTESGRRAVVLIEGVDNQTSEARLDGVVETALEATLYASPRIDPYAGGRIGEFATDLGLGGSQASLSDVAREASAEGHAVYFVTGGVFPSGDSGAGFKVALAVSNAKSGAEVMHAERSAADAAGVVAASQAFALSLRSTLGDPPRDSLDERVELSSSIEAMHEWSLARAAVSSGDLDSVALHANRSIAADPQFLEPRIDLSLAHRRNALDPEVVEDLESVIKTPERLCERRRLDALAIYYATLGHFAAAMTAYQQYLLKWPSDLNAQVFVAMATLDERDWPISTEFARQAVREHPRAPRARSSLAMILFKQDALDEAIREEEGLLVDRPRSPEIVFSLLEESLALAGRPLEALDVMRGPQSEVDPEVSDEAQADLAMFQGRLDDANDLLVRRIGKVRAEHDATFARTEYIALAELRLRRGDRAGARAAAMAALPEARTESAVYEQWQLARVLLDVGLEPSARSLAAGWSDSKLLKWRQLGKLMEGDALVARSNLQQAIVAYEDAGRLDDTWDVHRRLGRVYLEQHAWADAERELAVCVARRTEGVEPRPGLHQLSSVYYDLARAKDGGKQPDAQAAYRTFLALEPEAQHDPWADDARRRVAALEPRTGQ